MAIEFTLPELGEHIESAEVVRVLVSVGDRVEKDQPLLEVETDKASIEVPSPANGTVTALHVREGDTVRVGQPLLTLEETTAEAGEKAEAGVETKEAAKVMIREERRVDREPIVEPTEPSATSTPSSRRAAVVEFTRRPPRPATHAEAARRVIPAAPSVRRLARELGIDIQDVPGSGPGGRISVQDVKNYARRLLGERKAETPAAALPTAPPLPDFSQWGEIERRPMSNVRRITAENMSRAWALIPHVTQHDKADITELERLRKQFAPRAEAAGGKLTITAIILKVAAAALKAFPQFNTSLDVANNEIIYKKYYHIGVAVDTDRGLLVPVIRDVDKKNLIELAVELHHMAEKARARKLTVDELQGGTFSITNLGGIGGTSFSPIVYYPQVAILGVSRAQWEPALIDGQFQPRLILPLSLSYDHRVIDGADAARFLRWIAEALEQPFRLILEG